MVVGVGREAGRKGPCEPQNAFCGIPSVKQYIRKGERKGENQESKSFRGTDTVGRDNMIQEL
jgi:hypothetical protein